MAIVYSYFRFSDPRQATGHSSARQNQYADEWATANGHILDKSLSMNDEGLSAYHQKHVKSGALGIFLKAIEEGRVPAGSILVVEQLDRLSRAEPIIAQAQMSQIINAGITIVTAGDGKIYSRESLKANPMDLVYSLLLMIRAHEESDTKSKRVKAAIIRQCEGWVAGTYKGIIRNGKDPSWVKWDGEKFNLVPERVEAIRTAISYYLQGYGSWMTMKKMNELKMYPAGNNNSTSHFYKLINNPCLIGVKRMSVDGHDYELIDYYPAVLTKDEFLRLQANSTNRKGTYFHGEIAPIITGQKILYCGYCGHSLAGQNNMSRIKRAEMIAQRPSRNTGYRRLICASTRMIDGTVCPGRSSAAIGPIETAIINYCSDQMNLNALSEFTAITNSNESELEKYKAIEADIKKKLDRLTSVLLESQDAIPMTFAKKARELEEELAEVQSNIKTVAGKINADKHVNTPQAADKWAELLQGCIALDNDARLQVRQMVADTFSKIVVYTRGIIADHKSTTADIILISKSGITKMLKINRKTGQLVRGEVVDTGK